MNRLLNLLRPSSWPINGKLAFAFLISALLPISLTALFGYRDTLDSVRQNRLRELQQLAVTTAGRVDELVNHSSRFAKTLQRSEDVRAALKGRKDGVARVESMLLDFLSSNDDLQEIMVLDAVGVVIASSATSRRGATLGPLPLLPASSSPRGIIAGITSFGDPAPTMLVAAPVLGSDGSVLGRIVLKLVPGALDALLAESTLRGRAIPFVVDDLGVILQHPDARLVHASLSRLNEADLARARAERRYGEAVVPRSLESTIRDPAEGKPEVTGAATLSVRMVGTGSAGYIEHEAVFSTGPEATGYAPILSLPWMVGVSEPRQGWEAPLRDVYLNVLFKVLMVAALAVLAGVAIFARDLVQPVRRLIDSAEAIRAGNYANARAEKLNDDELGELTQTFNSMADSVEKRERERDLFGRMVSPEVREKMLSGQLQLGGENREVVVLFSDIRDFTTLCEGMSAAKVVEMLNEYLTEMAEAVKEFHGYVSNFMGDAIMVVFGAPSPHPDSSWAAVQAAFGMRQRLQELNRRRMARGEMPIKHGIGLASGVVVAGQMGSIERFQYTVIGDAVNVAARLESLTKEYPGNPILTTAEIVAQVKTQVGLQGNLVITELDERQLKGRSQTTRLYSLTRKA